MSDDIQASSPLAFKEFGMVLMAKSSMYSKDIASRLQIARETVKAQMSLNNTEK
jgi:DNA-binding CsgD family transcriptional regulator